MVTVDCVVLRVREQILEMLLIRRGIAPYKGSWALPGGFVKMKEPLEIAALRELGEETGLTDIPFMIQLGAYGEPKRDPRGRVISVAFVALVTDDRSAPSAGDDADDAQWHRVEALPDRLAFDHAAIIGDALRRLAAGGRTSGVLFAFLPGRFTEEQVGNVLQAVYGVALDPADYLKPFLKGGLVRRLRGGKRYRFTGWQDS
jgi:8-oxo-dGTP diphosphatase